MRVWLVGLIVLATIGFVIGTSIERRNSAHESSARLRAEGAVAPAKPSSESSANHVAEAHAAPGESKHGTNGERGESAATHAAETAGSTTAEADTELRPLGVDIEAPAFVALAALTSLALAALGYRRPRSLLGLAAIAAAMALFGALDAREAWHQSDENQTGLVILAAMIAALHLAAAGIAVALAARRRASDSPGAPGTIPA
jgi:hypothetical protein